MSNENESLIIPAFVTIAQTYVNTGATQVVLATKGLGSSAHKPTDPAIPCYPDPGCN